MQTAGPNESPKGTGANDKDASSQQAGGAFSETAFSADVSREAAITVASVRELSLRVSRLSEDVGVDLERARVIGQMLSTQEISIPEWSWPPYPQTDSSEQLARFMLVLNAINYCYFHPGEMLDESSELRFSDEGVQGANLAAQRISEQLDALTSAAKLSSLTAEKILDYYFLAEVPIPLAEERASDLREVGEFLQRLEARGTSFMGWLESFHGNGQDIAEAIISEMPGFSDPFLKRAQLLPFMIYGRFQNREDNPIRLDSLEDMTLIADYRIPQTLTAMGVLKVNDELATKIANRVPLDEDSPEEAALRAASIVAGDAIISAARFYNPESSFGPLELDFLLWKSPRDLSKGTADPALFQEEMPPHHQTITTRY